MLSCWFLCGMVFGSNFISFLWRPPCFSICHSPSWRQCPPCPVACGVTYHSLTRVSLFLGFCSVPMVCLSDPAPQLNCMNCYNLIVMRILRRNFKSLMIPLPKDYLSQFFWHLPSVFFFWLPHSIGVPRTGIRSEPKLWPMQQRWQQPDPLTHCEGPGIKLIPFPPPGGGLVLYLCLFLWVFIFL